MEVSAVVDIETRELVNVIADHMEQLLGDTPVVLDDDLDGKVREVIDEIDLNDKITEALDEYEFGDKIHDSIDVDDLLRNSSWDLDDFENRISELENESGGRDNEDLEANLQGLLEQFVGLAPAQRCALGDAFANAVKAVINEARSETLPSATHAVLVVREGQEAITELFASEELARAFIAQEVTKTDDLVELKLSTIQRG